MGWGCVPRQDREAGLPRSGGRRAAARAGVPPPTAVGREMARAGWCRRFSGPFRAAGTSGPCGAAGGIAPGFPRAAGVAAPPSGRRARPAIVVADCVGALRAWAQPQGRTESTLPASAGGGDPGLQGQGGRRIRLWLWCRSRACSRPCRVGCLGRHPRGEWSSWCLTSGEGAFPASASGGLSEGSFATVDPPNPFTPAPAPLGTASQRPRAAGSQAEPLRHHCCGDL